MRVGRWPAIKRHSRATLNITELSDLRPAQRAVAAMSVETIMRYSSIYERKTRLMQDWADRKSADEEWRRILTSELPYECSSY